MRCRQTTAEALRPLLVTTVTDADTAATCKGLSLPPFVAVVDCLLALPSLALLVQRSKQRRSGSTLHGSQRHLSTGP